LEFYKQLRCIDELAFQIFPYDISDHKALDGEVHLTVYSKVQAVYFQAYKLQLEIFSLQLQSLSLAAKIKLEIYVLIIL